MEIKFTIKDEVTRSLVRLSEHFGESTVNRSVEIILKKQLDRDHVSILIDTEPHRETPKIYFPKDDVQSLWDIMGFQFDMNRHCSGNRPKTCSLSVTQW